MWLIIDDERTLGCEVIARTAEAGIQILQEMKGCFDGLCIDHNLGCERTGYDILQWALYNGFLPDRVQVVSQNPTGRKRMIDLLICDAGYHTADNTNFTRIKE